MYRNLIVKEAKEHKWKLIIGLIILIVASVSLPLTFDYIFDFMEILEVLPGPLGGAIYQEMHYYLSDYDVYLWSQWNGKNLTQIAGIIALLLGATAIASETSKGTLEYLLSKPVTKAQILTSKIMVGLVYLLLIVLIPSLTMILASVIIGKTDFGVLVTLGLIPVFFGMVVYYFVGLLFSIFTDDSIKAFAFAAGVVILNSLLAFTKSTQKFSLSYHTKGVDYVVNGSFPYLSMFILIGLSAILAFICYQGFLKKEY